MLTGLKLAVGLMILGIGLSATPAGLGLLWRRRGLLLPGAVFVVDTPAKPTRVWWIQSGRGEESELAFDLDPSRSRIWFLRWDLKPTCGYLRTVDELQARGEIEPLGISD